MIELSQHYLRVQVYYREHCPMKSGYRFQCGKHGEDSTMTYGVSDECETWSISMSPCHGAVSIRGIFEVLLNESVYQPGPME